MQFSARKNVLYDTGKKHFYTINSKIIDRNEAKFMPHKKHFLGNQLQELLN